MPNEPRASNHEPRASNTERVLAFLIVGIVAVSLLAFLAVIIGTATGLGTNDEFSQGPWPAIVMLPLFGLPLAFLLIVTLIVLSVVRRGRATKRTP